MEERFWTGERLDVLAAFLKLTLSRRNRLSAETACEAIKDSGRTPPRPRTLRDFYTGKIRVPKRKQGLVEVLEWTLEAARERSLRDVLNTSEHAAALELHSLWRERLDGDAPGPVEPSLNLHTLIDMVSLLLNIRPDTKAGLISELFERSKYAVRVAEKDRLERYFLCYRYHSSPGYVVKSHLRILGPNKGVPAVCRFVNAVRLEKSDVVEANGVLLPMPRATYLFGEVDNGAGVTLAAIPGFSGDKIHSGLFLSFDEDKVQIAGRIVIVPTDIPNPDAAGIGTFPETDLIKEMMDFYPRLRNTVEFRLAETVYLDGEETDQAKVVQLVGDLLKPEKTARLQYADGKPFNPADTAHYTYNAALRIWQANERARTPPPARRRPDPVGE